jgi:hypothetical protein
MRTNRQTKQHTRAIAARPSILIGAAAALLAIALFSLAGGAAAKQGQRSAGHRVLYYLQHAKRGTFEHVHRHHYVLTLGGVPHRIAAYSGSGREPRKGKLSTARFVGNWHRLGFDRIRPRAVLLQPNAPPRRALVHLRLGEPSYSRQAKTIRYPVRVNANDQARRRFGRARLVIDGHSGVGEACTIEPLAQCEGADLHGRNLFRADLIYANLRGANLSYANLSYAGLDNADLSYADLRGADLRGAKLRFGTDLSYANLSYADLRYADLSGADLTGADLGAIFCRTTMPDDSINNSDC